ncbi:hypothetical protein ENHYDAX1_130531 [Enhydrobacter sp. AX1]|nr:hypothetical protein ENHYDAX1_130531 [Enhydrobacter sp. AX1]
MLSPRVALVDNINNVKNTQNMLIYAYFFIQFLLSCDDVLSTPTGHHPVVNLEVNPCNLLV